MTDYDSLDDDSFFFFFFFFGSVCCQVPGVTPNETRDPDGTGRIVKFGPDRVEEGM